MSTPLSPSPAQITVVRTSIQGYVTGNFPVAMRPGLIAPLLGAVNQWSTQIPVLLESVASINQVFDIRGDLFIAPRFSTNVFNIPYGDLPSAFHDFMTFISKLIEAQKANKEKVPPKASLFLCNLFSFAGLLIIFSIFIACQACSCYQIQGYCG
jgi:hypothetical protein